MKLEDFSEAYEQLDPTFWDFTRKLERKGSDLLPLLSDAGYMPNDINKCEAHRLLDEIETWKAGCDAEVKGNFAIQNSPSDVWNALQGGVTAQSDIAALRSIMTLTGFGRTNGMAKRASAVLRMLKPEEWGVVDWRAAGVLRELALRGWNIDDVVTLPPNDRAPWDTYSEINAALAVEFNQIYRSKRSTGLPRTADVEMVIYAVSFKVNGWNRKR